MFVFMHKTKGVNLIFYSEKIQMKILVAVVGASGGE